MKEILFRAKSAKTNEWVYGYYFAVRDYKKEGHTKHCIQPGGGDAVYAPSSCVEITPNTLGQFTGKLDRNGKKIFEGDVVSCYIPSDELNPRIGAVEYVERYGAFFLICYNGHSDNQLYAFERFDVLGNVHDMPKEELLAVSI